jgi:hypothetical protein
LVGRNLRLSQNSLESAMLHFTVHRDDSSDSIAPHHNMATALA